MTANNTFFAKALRNASHVAGKPSRLFLLVARLTGKLSRVEWKKVRASDVREKFSVFGRLMKAYATGRYRQVPWKTLLLVVAAVLYFVNPVDLVPDLLPVLGLTDDFSILLWVYHSASAEIDRFLEWEKSGVAAL